MQITYKKYKYKYVIISIFILFENYLYKLRDNTNNSKTIIKKNNFIKKKNNSNSINNHCSSKINYYQNFINDTLTYDHTHIYSDNIYWCWLQGIDKAPDLYKATFNSVKKECNNHNIIIINKINLHKYIKFPSFILEKYKKNVISNTHFSDLLRLELLIKYGGTWIDASVLITKYEKIFFRQDLFFFKSVNHPRIAGSNWFITSEKGSPILKSTRDLLYEYWRKENNLCDYFIFHLLFKLSYQKYYNDYLDMPNFSNVPPHYLQRELIKKFNYTKYLDLVENISIHKLTKKLRFSLNKYSFANFIINHYLK